MGKTESVTVPLSPEQRNFVKHVATQECISEAAVIRRLVVKEQRGLQLESQAA